MKELTDQLNRIEQKMDRLMFLVDKPPVFNIDQYAIRGVIIEYFNITDSEFISSRQVKAKNVLPRTFFFFFCRALTPLVLRSISSMSCEDGKERNHATIINGINNVCNWLEIKDPSMMYHYDHIYLTLEHKGFDMGKIKTFLDNRIEKQNSSLKHLRNA